MDSLERLRIIEEISKKKGKTWQHQDLFRLLYKDDIWITAYQNIKGNKGALTPGVHKNITADSFSFKILKGIKENVILQKYDFSPVLEKLIEKRNGKFRPLGIPTFNDRIVQEVIRLILEAIYEPLFSDNSFGFRPNKGIHNALLLVEDEFRYDNWIIEGDIKSAFPTVNHSVFISILEQNISDKRFINLIRKLLKAGVLRSQKIEYDKLGVPQGAIVSPLISNIYLHQFDNWIKTKQEQYSQPKSIKRNPRWKNLSEQARYRRGKLANLEKGSEEYNTILKEIKSLNKKQLQLDSLVDKPLRIHYVRYADDWLIGVSGNYEMAKTLKAEISSYLLLDLKMQLSEEKTKITHLENGVVSFLGYNIFRPRNKKVYKIGNSLRRSFPMLRFTLPKDKVIKKLVDKGYLMWKNGKVRPRSKSELTVQEDFVIVEHFKTVWYGLANFYSGITKLSDLQYIHYLMHISCAMTLAHRHRSSCTKIIAEKGNFLTVRKPNGKETSFPYRSEWSTEQRSWKLGYTFKNIYDVYQRKFTRSYLESPCCVCNSTEKVEMHHVKHVRKMNERTEGFTKLMSLLNRKQVPLCKNCHQKVHRGEYDSISLKDLAYKPI